MAYEFVDWETAAGHIWHTHQILIEWVKEACADVDRVILDPDPASKSGRSLRIVGFSSSFGHPITVVAIRRQSRLEVTSAWRSNSRDARIYRERQANDGK